MRLAGACLRLDQVPRNYVRRTIDTDVNGELEWVVQLVPLRKIDRRFLDRVEFSLEAVDPLRIRADGSDSIKLTWHIFDDYGIGHGL